MYWSKPAIEISFLVLLMVASWRPVYPVLSVAQSPQLAKSPLPVATSTLPNLGTKATTTPLTLSTAAHIGSSFPSVSSSSPHEASQVTLTVTSIPSAEVPTASPEALQAAGVLLRNALVNILCFAPSGSGVHSISASGVIVDGSGYILTNAHVAQYFLLADQGVRCSIRTGDPAKSAYSAKPAFIPREWIRDNSSVLLAAAPSGTGERDFALLAITGSATDTPLPASFPFVPLSATSPQAGMPVVIGSYGAQFLVFNEIQTSLSPTIVYGSVKKFYTFGSTTPDVLGLGGSAAAQEGSSGGGAITGQGALAGTITTSTVEGDTSNRSLSAISASYVRREYEQETGRGIDLLFAQSPAAAAAAFMGQARDLEALLLKGFSK